MSKKEKTNKQGLSLGVKLLLTPEVSVMLPILVLCIVTSILKPSFLTWKYISSILMGSVYIGTAALGQCLVSMSGEIDLSVGMSGCFAGVMMGTAAYKWGWPLIPCLLICLATGILVGAINGLCVSRLGLSGWITTLATQYVCQGLAVTICQGEPYSIMSLGLGDFSRAKPLGLNWLFFIFIFLILILDVVIRRSRFGYQLRAVGGNYDAAVMAGINAKKIKMMAFVLSGFFAALAGMFDVINAGASNSAFGSGREFRTIICCAVGGIASGQGSAYGVALGVLLFHTLWYCLRILDVNTNLQLVLIGMILIVSVIMDIQRKRLEARKMV